LRCIMPTFRWEFPCRMTRDHQDPRYALHLLLQQPAHITVKLLHQPLTTVLLLLLHSVSKKLCHCTFVHKFDKCWPASKILSLLHSPRNLQQNPHHNSQHTLQVSLHTTCHTQQTKTGKILLHLTQSHLLNVQEINKQDMQNNIHVTWS